MTRLLSFAAAVPLVATLLIVGLPDPPAGHAAGPTFDDDVAFLRQHTVVVVLGEAPGARVAVVPAWQGRVMTSTARAGSVRELRLDQPRADRVAGSCSPT